MIISEATGEGNRPQTALYPHPGHQALRQRSGDTMLASCLAVYCVHCLLSRNFPPIRRREAPQFQDSQGLTTAVKETLQSVQLSTQCSGSSREAAFCELALIPG